MEENADVQKSRAYHERRINRKIGKAIAEFRLIDEEDKILVAVSGGKDSLCLLHFLEEYRRKAPVSFEILAVNLDQGQPGFPEDVLPRLFEEWGVPHRIVKRDTYSIVSEKIAPGKTTCSLCSRLRRGILYDVARENSCNKIALGHHREDLLQTFLMNAFFNGKLGSMPPVYQIREGDLRVIRPLYAVHEEWLAAYAKSNDWPIIPCNLCGTQENGRRKEMERLLSTLEKTNPRVRGSLLGALRHVHRNQLLDPTLWDDPDCARPDGDGISVRTDPSDAATPFGDSDPFDDSTPFSDLRLELTEPA